MDLYVVKIKRTKYESLLTSPLRKEVAEKVRDGLNEDFQTDEYYIEIFEAGRFFSFD